MNSEPDNSARRALDAFSRQATAAAPTRIPSLADLRRRAQQRRRRRNLARLALAPTAALVALGAWAILDRGDEPTRLAVVSEPEAAPDTTAPPGEHEATPQADQGVPTPDGNVSGAAVETLGPFVWPAPPRDIATLDELVEQFAVEVLGSRPDSVAYKGATNEKAPQAFVIYPEFNPEISGETHSHELFAVALPSTEGWGFVDIGGRPIGIEETADGAFAVDFRPPGGAAANTVEIRYTDGEATSDTVDGFELTLPAERSPESVASVMVRHLDENGRLNTVTGRQFGISMAEIHDDIRVREEAVPKPTVPQFVGLSAGEAVDLLREHDYHLAGVAFDEAADAEPGTVIATSPEPGELIETYGSITLTIAGGKPSQSPEDAARDQIVPELAALPTAVRVLQADDWAGPTLVETAAGIWLISRMDSDVAFALTESTGCGFGATEDSEAVYGRDVVCLLEYAEILLLDAQSGEILRAYPFSGAIPRQILRTDDALYCISQSDGGIANSMLCRIDLATLEPAVRIFPRAGSEYDWSWVPRGWTINDPVGVVLWENLAVTDDGLAISGHHGSAKVDPDTLELLNVELDG